jgi:chemotaxis signal transduction protein
MNHNNEELQILTFNIGGVGMAVDTSQVDRMMDIEDAIHMQSKFEWIDDKILFHGKVAFTSPTVLWIKDEKIPFGIVIDKPGDIVSVPFDSLRPLPALLSGSKCPGAIWGAVLMNDNVILLVDFYKLRDTK